MSEAIFSKFLSERQRMDQQAMRTLLGLLMIIFVFMNVYIQLYGSFFQRIAIPVETGISILGIIIGSLFVGNDH